MRPIRGSRSLRKAARFVCYEVTMAGLAVGLIQKAKQCGDSAAHNAALESFLVHYRALRDFLHADKYPKRQIRNDDIIAEDFSPNDWGLKRPPWQECLSNEKE